MTHKPDHWTATDLHYTELSYSLLLAQAAGWSFFEHPELGDEGHVLAVSLEYIGDSGPVVFDTHDYDVPEFI